MSPWLAPGLLSRGGAPQARDLERLCGLQALPTKMAEKRTYTHLRSRRRLFGPLSSGFKHGRGVIEGLGTQFREGGGRLKHG